MALHALDDTAETDPAPSYPAFRDAELRQMALHQALANGSTNQTPERAIAAAEKYLAFMRGDKKAE